MSTVKISELTALTSADAADELVIVDDSAGVTKKITAANLNASFDASALDDYEEGTWTPVYEGTTTNPSGAYVQTFGKYIKIGKMVSAYGRIRGGATVSKGTGALLLAGLPYNIANTANNGGSISIGTNSGFNTEHPVSGFLQANNDYVVLSKFDTTSALSRLTDAQTSDLDTGSNDNQLLFSLVYETA